MAAAKSHHREYFIPAEIPDDLSLSTRRCAPACCAFLGLPPPSIRSTSTLEMHDAHRAATKRALGLCRYSYDHSDVHDVRESRCVWSHSSCCLPRQLLIVRTLLCMWQQKQMIIEPSLSSTFTTMFTILSDYIIRLAASSSNPPLHVICI